MVVINDALNLQAAMEVNIDGTHVKEKDAKQIP
jgi:thiamine monophosphate synthase